MSLSDVNNESAGADAQTALFEDVPTRLDASSTALVVLSLIALIVFLHWARAVFIPITFAVLLSYAFTPVVAWLQRNAKLPKVLGAAFVLLTACLGLGLVGTEL